MFWLEVTSDSRPDPGRDLIVRWSLVEHLARLEVARRNAETHLVHPQRLRHQRENPPMMDGRESRLVNLDDAVRPVLRALQDQAAGVGKKEAIIVLQVEQLGVPSGVV